MKLNIVLPWLVAVGAIAGFAWLHSGYREQQAQIAKLQADSQELQTLRTDEEARKTQAQADADELVRLRKDNEDLLRLRNEVRLLREDKAKIAKDAQAAQNQLLTAQAQIQNATAQNQALRDNAAKAAQAQLAAQLAAQQPQTPEQIAAAQAAFRARYGIAAGSPQEAAGNACINNLRQIDGAKQQWALENKKTANDLPSAADLAPYLKGNAIPACPGGGSYTLNSVGQVPACSAPGHALGR
jgi:chromosome segregation ATPase